MTGSDDHTARLWDATTGIPIGQPLEHSGKLTGAAFSPDGSLAATGSDDRTVRIWDVPAPVKGEAKQIVRWAEATTGLELDSLGAVRKLNEATLAERRQELERIGAPENTNTHPVQGPEWHLRVAMSCLTNGQQFAAAWHLDRLLTAQPDNWSGYLLRSRVNLQLGRRDEAARDYASAFRCGPTDRVVAEGLRQAEEHEVDQGVRLGDKSWKAKQLAIAVWHYDQVIAARPDDWKLRTGRPRFTTPGGWPAATP